MNKSQILASIALCLLVVNPILTQAVNPAPTAAAVDKNYCKVGKCGKCAKSLLDPTYRSCL
jgi:hypothetical protein